MKPVKKLRPEFKEKLPEVVKRFCSGERGVAEKVGAEYGVSRDTVYMWLLGALGDEQYHELITKGLVSRISMYDGKLEGAGDTVEVAKYHALARFARQDYERRRPALYGQKQLNVNVQKVEVSAEGIGRAAELLKLIQKPEKVIEQDGSTLPE